MADRLVTFGARVIVGVVLGGLVACIGWSIWTEPLQWAQGVGVLGVFALVIGSFLKVFGG